MKILVIHNHYREPGGEDAVVEAEVKMLKDRGHKVIVYIRSNKEIEDMSFFRRLVFIFRDSIWNKDSYQAIKNIIEKENPDIAHLHNVFLMMSPSVYVALREHGVPMIQTIHNYRLLCPKATFFRKNKICEKCSSGNYIYSIIYRCWRGSGILTLLMSRILQYHERHGTFRKLIDHFITLTKLSRDKFIRAGFDPNSFTTKHNFVHAPEIDLDREIENYALFVGRLSDGKGVATLLSAWQEMEGYSLLIAGDGPMRKTMENFIKKNNIKGIQMLGRKTNDEVRQLMYKANFLIFPSEWYECFPVTIVESFAMGTPVIASKIGGMMEIIEEKKTGLFFMPGDPSDLAKKAQWVLAHPEEMRTMGRNARQSYDEHFTPEVNYQTYMDIIQKTIENKKLQKAVAQKQDA